jgi:hypothetical protein
VAIVQHYKIKLIFAGIMGIFLAIFLFSTAMINPDKIKQQIDKNISYKSILVKKFPYPKIYLKDVIIGDARIDTSILHISLLSLLSFSHKIQNIELRNIVINSKNDILGLQDFHNILQNIWTKKEDIGAIDMSHILVNGLMVPSASISCGKSSCDFAVNSGSSSLLLRASKDKGDIIALAGSCFFHNYKIQIEEKYDTKTKNFIGNFKLDQMVDIKNQFQGEIVGNSQTTHYRNISASFDFLKGAGDYAIFTGKNSSLKSNIDYLEISDKKVRNLFSVLKSYCKDLFLDMKIASAKIASESISDIKIMANSDDAGLNITNFSGKLEGEDSLIFTGKLTEAIDGHIDLSYSDLNKLLIKIGFENLASKSSDAQKLQFSSDIHIEDQNYHFSNISSKVADQVGITGQFGVRVISDTPRVLAALDITSLDFNNKNYPIIDKLFSYMISAASNMKSENYSSKFDPIKNLGYKLNSDLYFSNAKIGEYKIDKMRSNFRIKDAHIDLRTINVKSEDIDLDISGELQAWGIKPILFMNLYGAKLKHIDYNHKSFIEYLSKNIDFKKMHFNLSLALDHLVTKNQLDIGNIRASINSDDLGGIKISNGIFDIFGGRVTSTSYFVTNDLVIDGVFGYNNFLLEPMVSYLSNAESGITGVASLNGKFHANLGDYTKFSNSLELSGSYIAKFIKLQNFGIDEFVEQVTKKDYDAKARLDYDSYYAILKGYTDIDTLSGSLDAKDGLVSFSDITFSTKSTEGRVDGKVKMNGVFANESHMLFEFSMPETKQEGNQMFNPPAEPQKFKAKVSLDGSIFAPSRLFDTNSLKIQMIGNAK